METVEATRARFRPKRITTLFVGESAPFNGGFFYCGSNAMLLHMQRAVEHALDERFGEESAFLERFKAFGWYLDDLVLTPVDHLPNAQWKVQCLNAQTSLANRIVEYRPLAIVSVLLRIQKFVEAAVIATGIDYPRYAVPFPGFGHQGCFRVTMELLIPKLPRLPSPF